MSVPREQSASCRVIAEAGVNHGGSVQVALALVDAAADAGAEAVKFQSFRTELLVREDAPQADYQRRNAPAASQAEMLRALELSVDDHRTIAARCAQRGIAFLSTAFDPPSLELLLEIGVGQLKVASGELTNAPMLLRMGRTGLPLLVSTGMATTEEVADALAVIAFGRATDDGVPDATTRALWRQRVLVQAIALDGVTLLHCTSSYPAPADSVNLRAMRTLGETFGLPIGYSDHTQGTAVPLAAVALGATVVEKHFTLDPELAGPDHRASLDPAGLRDLVSGVRDVVAALGSDRKEPQAVESDVRQVARRSLVAARNLSPDVALTDGDLIALRPGDGMPPVMMWDLAGVRPSRAYRAGEVFEG